VPLLPQAYKNGGMSHPGRTLHIGRRTWGMLGSPRLDATTSSVRTFVGTWLPKLVKVGLHECRAVGCGELAPAW
jgi:hypothetical protein